MKKNNKGFTLVELIVVLVILAILAAILTPALLGYIDRARAEKDYSTAQTIRVAAQAAIDQAYGDGYKTDGSTAVTSIQDMDGSFTGTPTTTDKYPKMVFTLATVDTAKVTTFTFNYTDGIITDGTVTINGSIYALSNNTWSVSNN